MRNVIAADGTEIWFATHGDPARPAILLGPHFYASLGRAEGDDTDRWIAALQQDFFLILADYPRGFGRTGNPLGTGFTPDIAADEYQRIADAAGVERFGWAGYSYGGAIGVQVACRTGRVSALAVGGFPPVNAPFEEMVDISTRMAKSMADQPGVDPKLLWSAVGFYAPLRQWREAEEVAKLAMPRLAYSGSADVGVPHMGVNLPLADILRDAAPALKSMGWDVAWLDGQDHIGTAEASVSLPVVQSFFRKALLPG